ncbi:MAG: STAS domain-containing protein [Chthoniobacterales bacterium]
MNTPSSVLVGCIEKTVWVKVNGRGSFQNSGGVKEFSRQMMNRGYRQFILDLENCELMDSTFMGTMAGIALRLRELGQGQVSAIHLNERNRDLLQNLGLDRIINTENSENQFVQLKEADLNQPAPAATTDTSRDLVLSAHEALVEADPQNAVRFKDVLEFLQQEAREEAGEN